MIAEPSLDCGGACAARPLGRPAAELQRWSAGILGASLAIAAMLLVWRRLAGALSSPLEPPTMLLVGLTLAGMAGSVRVLWHRALDQHGRFGGGRIARLPAWVAALLPSISLVSMGAALSLPGTSAGGLAVFWTLLGVEELFAWRHGRWRAFRGQPAAGTAPRSAGSKALPETVSTGMASPGWPTVELPTALPAPEVLQQLTRSHAADGSEELSGWLRMSFSPGQRTGNLHVAFCPPFARTPELSVRQLGGPAARIKTAQLLPYGARLDLKLAAAAASPSDLLLQFSARSAGEREPLQ